MTKRRKPQPQPAPALALQMEVSTYKAPVDLQPGDDVKFRVTPKGQVIITRVIRAGVQIWPNAD